MADDPKPREPEPSLGRIVIYRTRDGVDVAAIVSAVIEDDERAVHLEQFPPPGVGRDIVAYQYGVPYSAEPAPMTWRWPERKP